MAMSDDQKRKYARESQTRITAASMGVLIGLHENIERIRDEYGPFNLNKEIDHNVEQALISIEVASLRMEQVFRILDSQRETPNG